MTLATWLWAARARRNVQRALRPLGPVEPLVDELAPGRSFVDVGALWEVHGAIAFRAEERGATSVTAMDVSAETEDYQRERLRRGSSVRFVQGDLHDPAARRQTGRHELVWCSNVLYHSPNPVQCVEGLRELTGELLVLISQTAPEIPGVQGAAVFFPGLSERQRLTYDRAYGKAPRTPSERIGLTTPFDPAQRFGNWWWGLTPSAVRAMLEVSGFRVERMKTNGFHTRIVARAV